jgi:hypothetical protein
MKNLNINEIRKEAIITIIGARCSGKTTLILDYFNHRDDFSYGAIISSSNKYTHEFDSHFKSNMIYDECTPELITKIIEHQRLMIVNKTNINSKGFLVFDDYNFNRDFWLLPHIKELFYNSRQLNITIIISSCYQLHFPPNIRCNFDYIFILGRITKIIRMQNIYKYYGDIFKTYDEFKQTITKYINTEVYNCLVIDILHENIYKYIADIHNKSFNTFKICSDKLCYICDMYTKMSKCVKCIKCYRFSCLHHKTQSHGVSLFNLCRAYLNE